MYINVFHATHVICFLGKKGRKTEGNMAGKEGKKRRKKERRIFLCALKVSIVHTVDI
jgi:hypothetical protein